MALTKYKSKQAITLGTRSIAYERIAIMCNHLDALNLNLLKLELLGDNFVEVSLNNPLPASQVDHLGLTGPI